MAEVITLKAMMYQTYDKLREQYPTHRFVFLTLTVKNCEIGELRSTLQHMNKSWQRLKDRKEFMAGVEGWIRTTEITRPKDPKDKNKKNKKGLPCDWQYPCTPSLPHTLDGQAVLFFR